MKTRSAAQILVLITTLSAVLLSLLPGRTIFLNSDCIADLSDGSPEDDANWANYLGRTEYMQAAWDGVNQANRLWNRKLYRRAVAEWWEVASRYRDTDAALAALENAANAEKELGNDQAAIHAWEMILLLPDVTYKDGGLNMMNYRHDACLALVEHYKAIHEFAYAERFLSQAIEHDYLHDTCGVYSAGVTMDLTSRLAALRAMQGK